MIKRTNKYVPGDWLRKCDVCGVQYLRSELKKQYNGLIVCGTCWDPQPQQEKPQPVRKEKAYRFD